MVLGISPTTGLPLLEERDADEKARLKCEATGGTWDSVNKICTPPEPEPEIPKEPSPPAPPGTVITDAETGEPKGFINSKGEFVAAGRKDIELATGRIRKKTAPIEGAVTAEQIQEQRRKLTLAKNVGQIDFELASQLEEQGLNVREIVFAGLQGIDIERAATLAGGAAITAGVVGGPAAPITAGAAAAVVGGGTLILDFFNDIRKNIKDQRQDLVRVKTKELRQRKTAMNNYIQAANMNPAQAEDYVLAYNIEKSLIRRDFNTLVKRGNEDLEFWGTDATPQIVEYEVFFESVQPSLDVRMEQAVLKPEPSRAFLTLGDEEE